MPEQARSIPRTAYRQERYRGPPRQSRRTRESCPFCSQLCRFARSFEGPDASVMPNGRMAGRLRNSAARRVATTAQGKEDRCSTGNRCKRDHDVARTHFRFPLLRRRLAVHAPACCPPAYQTDEFAGLLEGVFDIDRTVVGRHAGLPTNGGQPTNSAATSIL